jgi:peptidoglycan/xylan/chitin deacetylase (PgdA/CDA1 family)
MEDASEPASHLAGTNQERASPHNAFDGSERDHTFQEARGKELENRGLFVVSLDFEQAWGVRHLGQMRTYLPRLIGGRSAVLSILGAFRNYEIHATWAVVGFLFAENGTELRKYLPRLKPQYADLRLSPYRDLPPPAAHETPESIFFAPSLIRQILDSPHQEIGTHTLSHYYCLELGQNRETFNADLMTAIALGRAFGLNLKSLVFPKNQWRSDFLDICARAGIIAYRGTPSSWLYGPRVDKKKQMLVRRFGRLLGAYLPLGSAVSHSLPLSGSEVPINIPESRFLRACMPALRALEPLRLSCIKREMTFAARAGRLYHLWWHPHDFGVNTEANLRFLTGILDHYRRLRSAYGFESVNMGEAAMRFLGQMSTNGFVK